MKPQGIRSRVLFVALAPAVAIALALAGYFLLVRYGDLEAALVSRGTGMARQFAPAAEYGVFSGNTDELQRLVSSLAQEPDVSAVTVFDRTDRIMVRVGATRLNPSPESLPDNWAGQTGDGATLAFHAKISSAVLSIDDPAEGAGAPTRLGSVTIEMSRAGIVAKKREIMLVTLLAAAITLALGMLLALRLAKDVTEPILAIEQAVDGIRRGKLATRVAPHRAQTLASLEDGINEMAAALQAGRDNLETRIREATVELKEQKDKAEQENVAKSRFLAAASHDLRQPLHALRLFAAELVHAAQTPPQRRLAGQIHSATDILGDLLEGLLEISRLDLGAKSPEPRAVALGPLIERVIGAHEQAARAKGLYLYARPTRACGLTDPHLLERILHNLVSNAVRYTHRGGIYVAARRESDDWRIEVRDSGMGIAAEYRHLVFKEFFQVANPERDPEKGVGLGLTLVERMARLLGHSLRLRSAPGMGSVFSLTLPRGELPEALETSAAPEAVDGFDARVLVFGAQSDACDSLCRLLSAWGCAVECVGTSDEAASREPGGLPDLIICTTGYDAEVSAFSERLAPPAPALPVIVVGADVVESHSPLRQPPHLTMPLRPAKLRALMRHLLDGGNQKAA